MDTLFRSLFLLVILASGLSCLPHAQHRYTPDWDSLDARPLPSWYDQAKIGIFIHWGVFSVPSFGSEWFWWYWQGTKTDAYVKFMQTNYAPGFSYADFAPMFTAEFYDPSQWAELFAASGAKYVVLVSKHHEGFTNWPSNYSWNWNSRDVGPHRDLTGELARAIRAKTDLHFGLYHSLFEWFHPLYLADKENNFTTKAFVEGKTLPELYEIVRAYEPDAIWSDGDWEANETYWQSKEFLTWLYNDSPVKDSVVVNDRWGQGTPCKHGGFLTCTDAFNPGTLQKRKWENCFTLDRNSWGYVRKSNINDYLTIEEVITKIAETVSCGGNVLINVGPTHDGRIVPVFQERLTQLGQWLKVNGEAIYGSHPWTHQNDTATSGVWYTKNTIGGQTAVYAVILSWPNKTAGTQESRIWLQSYSQQPGLQIHMLGLPDLIIPWSASPNGGIIVHLPAMTPNEMPCQWAWVLKLTVQPKVREVIPENL